MEIDRKTARVLSMMGQKGTFGMAVSELAEKEQSFVVLAADLANSVGLEKFCLNYSQLFYNIGIAEQNMIGIAAGMAKMGINVFVNTFASFMTMRCYEQIRMNLGYMQLPIKIIGTRAGIVNGIGGNSHYAIEDIAIMRAIPNLVVVSPADCVETMKIVQIAMQSSQPMYIRLTGGLNTPMIYKEDYSLKIGKAISLRQGKDIALIATGTMVNEALKAAKLLAEHNFEAEVINMHTIKPLDIETLERVFAETNLIVTVEEHSKIGGLGSAVAEYKATKNNAPPQLFIGLPDTFGKAGAYEYLLDKYGLTAAKICEQIIERLRELPK